MRNKKETTFMIVSFFVGATGFEPAATWSQTRSATGLRYTPRGIVAFKCCSLFASAKVAPFSECYKLFQHFFLFFLFPLFFCEDFSSNGCIRILLLNIFNVKNDFM